MRKPAHIEMAGGKGPRQRIWEAIRELSTKGDKTFTTDSICRRVDVPMTLIHDYVRGLSVAGYISLAAPPVRCVKNVYRLSRDVGAEAPRVTRAGKAVTQGLAQEQMWRTLRAMKGGDINARELAAFSSTREIPVAEEAANSFLQDLNRANYLQRTAEGKGRGRGGVQARYRLITDTGPRTPMVQRTDAIYDPNLDQVIWMKPINEETAIYGH